ncbi:MAG: hypothetical protein ACKOUS_21100, partial [Alphaproteobacteria bacterium]
MEPGAPRSGARLVPDAADERRARLGAQDLRSVLAVEPGLRDHGAGKPVRRGDALHPARLAQRVVRVPFGLDVDGADDRQARGVGEVVRRQVGAAQRRVVAVAEGDRRLLA